MMSDVDGVKAIMKNLFRKRKQHPENVPVSKQNTFNIEVPYEYPFSMGQQDLQKSTGDFIQKYNEIYTAISPTIYIRNGKHRDGKPSTIEDISNLIERGNNELSRRTNEKILKQSLLVSKITLVVAIVSCIAAICSCWGK